MTEELRLRFGEISSKVKGQKNLFALYYEKTNLLFGVEKMAESKLKVQMNCDHNLLITSSKSTALSLS